MIASLRARSSASGVSRSDTRSNSRIAGAGASLAARAGPYCMKEGVPGGSTKRKAAPPEGARRTSTLPPWPSTRPLTMPEMKNHSAVVVSDTNKAQKHYIIAASRKHGEVGNTKITM